MTKTIPGSSQASSNAKSAQALARMVQKRAVPAAVDAAPLSEIAYQRIIQAIQEGTIESNTHLTEVELATWLQMSRTPVREAMRRLEGDGLLLNQPFRGAVVMTLSEDDVRELYVVRELLEVAAAGWCAVNASEGEIVALREIIRLESSSLLDPHALIGLNRKFHKEICNGAHNHFLMRTLGSIQSSFILLGRSKLLNETRARAAHNEHKTILDAIERHDRKGAEDAARAHVQTSLATRLIYIAELRKRKK